MADSERPSEPASLHGRQRLPFDLARTPGPWREGGPLVLWRVLAISETRHDKARVPVCSDWGSCGRDCALSEVSCRACGTMMSM